MKLEHLERAFESIGARLRVEPPVKRWGVTGTGYSLDIGHDRHGQFFALRGDDASLAEVEISLLNKQKEDRHLLLLVKNEDAKRKDRFLCGHDEREWFVAAIPGPASTVVQAKEALKPAPVRQVQARKGLNRRQANTRHNAAFRRQGEWFFVPMDKPMAVDPKLILRNEPISRGGGSKPHLVEQLYRTGGEKADLAADAPESRRVCPWCRASSRPRHHRAARLVPGADQRGAPSSLAQPPGLPRLIRPQTFTHSRVRHA